MEETFKEKIDQLAEAKPSPVNDDTAQTQPKKRGRPVGFSPKAVKAEAEAAAKVVPPVNEQEADLFAQVFAGVGNTMIRAPYKEKVNFTKEEMLNIARPLVQLKAYYMPNFGGIYAIWTQLALAAGGLGISKYQIIKEIMDKENGKKDHTDIGDQGNRQVNESKGIIEGTPPRIDI